MEFAGDFVVGSDDTATRWAGETLNIVSTPAIIGHVESMCAVTMSPTVSDGFVSVGSRVDMKHVSSAPEGARLSVSGRYELSGRKHIFEFEVRDPSNQIVAIGKHWRAILPRTSILSSGNEKV
jgi:fluoroacetyl-CoA thioesterase